MIIRNLDRSGGTSAPTGVLLSVVVPATYRPVIERGASSTGPWEEVAALDASNGGALTFFDPLPLDNVTRWYRARSRRDGELDSAATAAVSAVPRQLR